MSFKFNPFTRKFDIVGAGSGPTSGIGTLTGDSGGSVGPDGANNVNLLTGTGITSTGDPGTNTITFSLDNYSSLTTTTTNDTPDISMTFALGATPGVYAFDLTFAAFNTTDTLGASFYVTAGAITSGIMGNILNTPDKFTNKDLGMESTDATLVISGNNAVFQVTGLSAKTIKWRVNINYTFVS